MTYYVFSFVLNKYSIYKTIKYLNCDIFNYSQYIQLSLLKKEFKGDAINQQIGIVIQDSIKKDTNNIFTTFVFLLDMIFALIIISKIDKEIVIV